MKRAPIEHILFSFFIFWTSFLPISGQDATLDWQEQILQQVDVEDLSEEMFDLLMDELTELTTYADTTAPSHHLRQQLVVSANRCLNTRAGYVDQTDQRQQAGKAYLGDPWRPRLRYQARYGPHWQAGFSLGKDSGEPWLRAFPHFDRWHAFVRAQRLQLTRRWRLDDAVIGHYRLRLGCGLVLSQGFSLGKQFCADQLWGQRSPAIMPQSSPSASSYMQGAAASLRFGSHLSLLSYVSARQVDGTLDEHHTLTALQTSDYHRTATEMSHRHQAWQTVTGLRLSIAGEWYDVGLHGCYTQLQYDYIRKPNYYNQHYFRGHQLAQYALDYKLLAGGFRMRGEVALDDAAGLASLNSLQAEVNERLDLCLTHRYFSHNYRQLHAQTMAESSALQGEQGLTLQFNAQPTRHWSAQGMVDWFHFAQPQFGIRDSTSQGLEALLRLVHTRHGQPNVSLSYRVKAKGGSQRHTLNAVWQHHPTQHLALRSQLRACVYNKETEASQGYLISQAATWQCQPWADAHLTIDAQATYFHTDAYDSRLYLTEHNVLYGFGLPMLYGEGLRYSLTTTLKLGARLSLDLKYALTSYANRATIGSGLQQIRGNNQQDLWLQLRTKF